MKTYIEKLNNLHINNCKFCCESLSLDQKKYFDFVDDNEDFKGIMEDTLTLQSGSERIAKKFDIGGNAKISRKLWGDDKGSILSIFKKIFSKGAGFKKSQEEIIQEVKDEVQEFSKDENGKTIKKYSNYEIKRLVRNQYAQAKIINNLLKWKEMGFERVRIKAKLDEKTGEKDRRMNGRVFTIDHLLSPAGDNDRPIFHINCRCILLLVD